MLLAFRSPAPSSGGGGSGGSGSTGAFVTTNDARALTFSGPVRTSNGLTDNGHGFISSSLGGGYNNNSAVGYIDNGGGGFHDDFGGGFTSEILGGGFNNNSPFPYTDNGGGFIEQGSGNIQISGTGQFIGNGGGVTNLFHTNYVATLTGLSGVGIVTTTNVLTIGGTQLAVQVRMAGYYAISYGVGVTCSNVTQANVFTNFMYLERTNNTPAILQQTGTVRMNIGTGSTFDLPPVPCPMYFYRATAGDWIGLYSSVTSAASAGGFIPHDGWIAAVWISQ